MRGIAEFRICPLEAEIVNKSCFAFIFKMQTEFTSVLPPDKHTWLLKIYFQSLVKQLKFSVLNLNWIMCLKITLCKRERINHEPAHVG